MGEEIPGSCIVCENGPKVIRCTGRNGGVVMQFPKNEDRDAVEAVMERIAVKLLRRAQPALNTAAYNSVYEAIYEALRLREGFVVEVTRRSEGGQLVPR